MELGFKNFEDMTIGELRKLTEDYKRLSDELTYVKAKYPRAKEELEKDDFDVNKFLEELK